MKLYYHTSSKNFSLIFETESVSPKSFYSKRSFGNTRFRSSPLDLSDEFITLYSKPMQFRFSESENYPMWLEFEKTSIENCLVDFKVFSSDLEADTIYLCPKTIYFDHQTFRCLFEDAKEFKYTKIDSESYRSVKTVPKFKIELIPIGFFKKLSQPGNFQVMDNSLLDIEIEKDKRFNHIKGLLYGYAIGAVKELKPDLKDITSLISELQSSFTNAKSQIIMQKVSNEGFSDNKPAYKSGGQYKSKHDYQPPKYSINDSKNEILEIIYELEKRVEKMFKGAEIETDPLLEKGNNLLQELEKESVDFFLINEFKVFLQNLSIRNKPFIILRKTIEEYFRMAVVRNGLKVEETEIRERLFKMYLKKIESNVSEGFRMSNTLLKGLNLDEIEFNGSYKISLNKDLVKLNVANEYILFEIIIKNILKNPRPKKQGEISRDEKREIIKNIGEDRLFQTRVGNKENPSPYYKDLLHLYNHYSKFIDLRIDRINSNILQNFASFVLKIDQLDELIEFCQTKDVANRKIAYAFWCAYNGFSEISEKNSKIIFGSDNWTLINSFDNYLNNVLRLLENEILESDFNLLNESNKELIVEDDNFSSKNLDVEVSQFKNKVGGVDSSYGIQNKIDNHGLVPQNIQIVESHLKKIKTDIEKSTFFLACHQKIKEDILYALNNTEKLVIGYAVKGTEIFSNFMSIIDILKKQIIEKNKARRNKEYKISDIEIDKFLKQLT